MSCKENAEKTCRSFPNCDGCNSHNKTRGDLIDRLNEFENLGYEPEDLKRIIERHHEMNRYSRDAFDALYYAYKTAGDIENSRFDDIRSMYPSTLLSPSGFVNQYVKNDEFRKLVTRRIRRAMDSQLDRKQIWITTSSNNDGIFVDKLKEAMKEAKKYDNFVEKLKNDICEKWNLPKSILESSDAKKQLEAYQYIAEDTDATYKLVWRHDSRPIGKVYNVEETKEGTKMTITKKPNHAFKIDRVIFNNPATIVFWADGDKTVVKAQNGEPYDPEKGLAMAISKKALGNGNKWYNEFKKRLDECDTPSVHSMAWCGYQRLLNALNDKKTTKADLIAAMEDAVGYFGEELQ